MKKIAILLALIMLLGTMAACSKDNTAAPDETGMVSTNDSAAADETTKDEGPTPPDPTKAILPEKSIDTKVEKTVSQEEYDMYLDVFYNKKGADYAATEYTKTGVFTILHDYFSGKDRYYVWGYSDDTMSCEWQWEFVAEDAAALPPVGSHVTVKGTLTESTDALDGYWLTGAAVEVKAEYKDAKEGFDTTTMTSTLTRVQLINVMNHVADHQGETMVIFGRIAENNMVQHPYYDNEWMFHISTEEELPPVGTWVTVEGKLAGTSNTDFVLQVDSITKH